MTDRRAEASRAIDRPEPGHFAMRLVKGGPLVAAQIVETAAGLHAIVCGLVQDEPAPAPNYSASVWRVWHSGTRIDEAEYRYRLRLAGWAKEQRPDHPAANPEQPISLLKLPAIF